VRRSLLVTGPGRFLSLKLSDTRVYEPRSSGIRGTHADQFRCGLVFEAHKLVFKAHRRCAAASRQRHSGDTRTPGRDRGRTGPATQNQRADLAFYSIPHRSLGITWRRKWRSHSEQYSQTRGDPTPMVTQQSMSLKTWRRRWRSRVAGAPRPASVEVEGLVTCYLSKGS